MEELNLVLVYESLGFDPGHDANVCPNAREAYVCAVASEDESGTLANSAQNFTETAMDAIQTPWVFGTGTVILSMLAYGIGRARGHSRVGG